MSRVVVALAALLFASSACSDSGDTGAASADAASAGSASDGGDVVAADAFVPGPDAMTESEDAIAVAVGYGMRRMRSEDGVAWTDLQQLTPNGGDDNDLFRGVGYSGGLFLAVGGASSGLSMSSTDGITWLDENRSMRAFLSDATGLGDGFVAAGGNGLRLQTLDGGQTWINEAPYFAGHFRAIASGGGVAVAVGHTYGTSPNEGIVSRTEDGVTWSEVDVGGPQLRSVAFGNGTFVVIGENGHCARSSDGTSWASQVLPGVTGALVFTEGEFWASNGSDGFYHSSDGVTWAVQAGDARSLASHFKGAFINLGWPASISRMTSFESWERVSDLGGSGFTQIAVGVPQ